jgi:hypothetical protein
MKSMRAGYGLALWITLVAAAPALAGEKAVNLSLFTPISLAKAEDSVTAFRFDFIYGKNTAVKIIDLGLVNQTTTLSNGLQWGFVNYNAGSQSGLQLAAVNYNAGSTNGLQLAGFNYAETAGGLQLAFINYARKLGGVQIGAINIASQGGMFPVMVIANWKK